MKTAIILNLCLLALFLFSQWRNKKLTRINASLKSENKDLKNQITMYRKDKPTLFDALIAISNNIAKRHSIRFDSNLSLEQKLADAIANEQYELARNIQNQIDKNKK